MIAFTFPGQGSQRPAMGSPWVDHPSWELVADASDAAGRDLADLLLRADAAELQATRNAQLATFTLSMVVLDAVERLGVMPALCAGHSLGEYSALVAAGSLSFDDGVRVVAERGEAMQGAAEERTGSMSAVLGLDDEGADAACRRAEGDAWVANYNAPGQVVLAGTPESLAVAGDVARELGAKKVMPLPVGGAFHTPLMASARDRLRKALAAATFCEPDVPVVANVDARLHDDADTWPGLLSAQLCSPVRWRQSLLALRDAGAGVFVELGPGGVLTGLAKRTVPGAQALAVATPDDLDRLMQALAQRAEAPLQAHLASNAGEHLYVSERVVVSPNAGLFAPAPASDAAASEGEVVPVGGLLGRVGDAEVRSPFRGWLMGLLAMPGERLSAGQPVAWLRTDTAASGAAAPSGSAS